MPTMMRRGPTKKKWRTHFYFAGMIPLNYTLNMKLLVTIATAIVIVVASPIMVVATAGGERRKPLFGVVAARTSKTKTVSTTTTSTSSLPMLGQLGRIPRGGAVHESSTLGDLESRIQSGALQEKLSVIDFTATW